MSRLLVSGPYGGYNIGDDAIAHAITRSFSARDLDVSLTVEMTRQQPFLDLPVNFVEPVNLRGGRFQTLAAIKQFDAVIIGGGEQYQEPRLPNPIWGHVATVNQLYQASRFYKRPFITIGLGVSDKLSYFARQGLRRITSGSALVAVRDLGSFERVVEICGEPPSSLFLGADPAFLLPPAQTPNIRESVFAEYGIQSSQRLIVVIPVADKVTPAGYLQPLNDYVRSLTAQGTCVLYITTDLQETYDQRLFTEQQLYEEKLTRRLIAEKTTIDSVCRLIAAADLVVSSRMHPLIFSAVNQTPFICLDRSAKMTSLMKDFGLSPIKIENVQTPDLVQMTRQLLESPPDLTQPLQTLRERAEAQFNIAATIIA